MAWVLQMGGIKPSVLKGGYKAFRGLMLETVNQQYNLKIIGGRTGSGKTEVVYKLKEAGVNTIDLEGFACHKGSAFGALGQQPQPTTEHFENLLGYSLLMCPKNEPIYLENESRLIGKVKIPDNFYAAMRSAQVFEVNTTFEERVKRIKNEYCTFPMEDLIACTQRLERKLGNLRMNEAVNFLKEGDLDSWVKMMLEYYDKSYSYGNSLRDPNSITLIDNISGDISLVTKTILNHPGEPVRN
jgi:tRNA 2-selenouridine synthase